MIDLKKQKNMEQPPSWTQVGITNYLLKSLVFWQMTPSCQGVSSALVRNVEKVDVKKNGQNNNAHIVWKNGSVSTQYMNFGSEIGTITRESGKDSKDKKLIKLRYANIKDIWRIGKWWLPNCAQHEEVGSFLVYFVQLVFLEVFLVVLSRVNLTDRQLQIDNTTEIVGFLIKKYKRVGFWYKRRGWRVEFHKRVNESIEGFKVTIMGPIATCMHRVLILSISRID